MQKKLTITIEDSVYKGLHKVIGRGQISQFIETLLRPHVLKKELDEKYKEMSQDLEREKDAFDWIEGLVEDHSKAVRTKKVLKK